MAEYGTRAAGQDCRHPLTPSLQNRMADRVDAKMDPVQGAAPKPDVDRAGTDSSVQQLPARNDPVLAFGKVSDNAIGRFKSGG